MILPAYNEEGAIEGTVKKILDAPPIEGLEVDYIVINDGSTDGTERVCRRSGIKCLSLVRNLGIGGAVQTGYLYAARNGYDIAVQFDGDGQHDIRSLGALVAPILEGRCDFVVGSRFLEGSGAFRSTRLRRAGIRTRGPAPGRWTPPAGGHPVSLLGALLGHGPEGGGRDLGLSRG